MSAVDVMTKEHGPAGIGDAGTWQRLLIEASPFPMMLHAEDGEVLALNARWSALTGYAAMDLPDHFTWFRLAYPDRAEEIARRMAISFTERGEKRIEGVRVRCVDETIRIWDFHLVRLGPGPDGRRLQLSAAIDVTDRHAAEAELKASAERLTLAKDLAGISSWEYDLVNGTVAWSDGLYEILGIDRSVAAGGLYEAWRQSVHPADRARAHEAVQRAAASGEPLMIEFRVRRPDGSVIWLRAQAVATRDDIGRPSKLSGFSIDVTAEREAQARLKERAALLADEMASVDAARREIDQLFTAYFEHTSEHLFVVSVDADGGFTFLGTNPANARDNGFSTELVRGKRPEELFDADTARAVTANYRRCVETGTVQRYAEHMPMPEGERHFETVIVPIRDAQNRVSRIFGSARDVTERVRLEEALRQAQKMEAIGQLTAGIAHDFNNLLGAVIGALDLIRAHPNDRDRIQSWAASASKAAERGATLTQQLLTFSRDRNADAASVDIVAVIRSMQDLLARTLGPLIALDIVDEGPAFTRIDPMQLEMALLNLAANARDAMAEGGRLTIAIRSVWLDGDSELGIGRYVEIAASDTGEGMSAETRARAVEPFFTTKPVGKGTGLGLSQVYAMAHRAGGALRIDSIVHSGTTVRMLLPYAEPPMPLGEAAAVRLAAAPSDARLVLLIDDDPDIRLVLAEAVRSLGHAVMEAEDGAVGLDLLAKTRPALMIVDFAMPGLNGAEVAKAARQTHPDLPIVLSSGYADMGAVTAALGSSVSILRKPFRIEELNATLGRIMGADAEGCGGAS